MFLNLTNLILHGLGWHWAWFPESARNKIRDLIKHLGGVEDLLKTSPEILIEQFQISSKLADLISKATQSHSFNIEKRIIKESPGVRLFFLIHLDTICGYSKYPLHQVYCTDRVNYRMQKVHVFLSSTLGIAQHMENNKRADSLKKSHNMSQTWLL
jgi:hypothetical protein